MQSSRQVALALLATMQGCDPATTDGSLAPASSSSAAAKGVVLAPGRFGMGSPMSEACRDSDEARVQVDLSLALRVDQHEVTQHEFRAALGYNPSFRKACGHCPVDSVTQHEAAAYCNVRSRAHGLPACYECSGARQATRCRAATSPARCGYRLPSEAEWEYAARAGSDGATYGGPVSSCMGSDPLLHRLSWYKSSSRGQSQPVGQKAPNAWRLFDMLGNVYEWTADWYQPKLTGGRDPRGPNAGNERVLRGGSWFHNAEHARSANRYALRPEKRLSYVGFRCVHSIDSKARLGAD